MGVASTRSACYKCTHIYPKGQQPFMGRPPGRIQDRIFRMRASDKFLKSVDAWRRKQEAGPSRAEAIRRLVEKALAAESSAQPRSKKTAQKASNMAAREIENLGDTSQPLEEQQRRKRSLIRGPREFRDIRADQPKRKG
jgi:hypothetical protein